MGKNLVRKGLRVNVDHGKHGEKVVCSALS